MGSDRKNGIGRTGLETRNRVEDERPHLAEIGIAHRIQHVGVRCRDQRFRVETLVKTTGDGLLLYCAMILEAALAQDVYTG